MRRQITKRIFTSVGSTIGVMNNRNHLEANLPPSYEEAVSKSTVRKPTQAHSAGEMIVTTSTGNERTHPHTSLSELHLEDLHEIPNCCKSEVSRFMSNMIPLCLLGGIFYSLNWTYYRCPQDFAVICFVWGIIGALSMVANWCSDPTTWGTWAFILAYLVILVGGGFLVRADIFRLAS